MRGERFPLLPIVLLFFMVSAGCQSNPVVPTDATAPEISINSGQTSDGGRTCLGYYSFIFDRDNETVEIIPMRMNQFHVNVTGILNQTMGVSAVGVPSEHDPPNGLFVFDITLTHPFGSKPQLAGFDVRGILMTPGSLGVGAVFLADTDETRLVNADGYTRWWNPSEFTVPGMYGYTQGALAPSPPSSLTARINPYKYFADVLFPQSSLAAVVDEPWSSDKGRGVFKAGESNTRRYKIRFPMSPGPQIIFGYAVDASWYFPDPNPPSVIPGDFSIDANQIEAWRVVFENDGNSLFYDSDSGVGGGVLKVLVNAFDWQGQDDGNIQNQIEDVRLYVPELMSGGTSAVYLNETELKARFTKILTGLNAPSEAGEVLVATKVIADGSPNYDQGPGDAPDATVSAWQVLIADVVDPDCDPDSNNTPGESITLTPGEIHIDQLCSPTDFKDFFKLVVPLGYEVSGKIDLYCDVSPSKLSFYDGMEHMLSEITVTDGFASIDLDSLELQPDSYLIQVQTQSTGIAFQYMLDPDCIVKNTIPSDPVDVTPDWLYYEPRWLCTYEDYVYAVGDLGVWIYDYASCADPEFLSFTDIESTRRPTLDWPYLFLEDSPGYQNCDISVLDVTDPSNPVLHEDIKTTTYDLRTWTAKDGYLWTMEDDLTNIIVKIYSYEDFPGYLSTHEIFQFGPRTMGDPKQMEFVYNGSGPNIWLATRVNKYWITLYDVTDLENVTGPVYASWPVGHSIQGFTVHNDFMYVLLDDGADNDSMEIVQMTSGGPVHRGIMPLDYDGHFVEWIYGYTYITYSDRSYLTTVDVSNPDSLTDEKWGLGTPRIWDLATNGTYLYFALGGGGVRTLNADPPGSVGACGTKYYWGLPYLMRVQDDIMFAVESYSNDFFVKSMSIEDPENPVMLDQERVYHSVNEFEVLGGRMVAGCQDNYIVSFYCYNPSNLDKREEYDTGSQITCLGLTEPALYVGSFSGGISIWDLSSFPTMDYEKTMLLPEEPDHIELADGAMYVGLETEIRVYTTANPLDPSYVTTYTPLAEIKEIEVDGDYLYIATVGSLEIVDISSPLIPWYVASVADPNAPDGRRLTVDGQFAYLQPYIIPYVPTTVMQVYPQDNPASLGNLYSNSDAMRVFQILAHDGYLYERELEHGLRIWKLY